MLMVGSVYTLSTATDLGISLVRDVADKHGAAKVDIQTDLWLQRSRDLASVIHAWQMGCYVFSILLLPVAYKTLSPVIISFSFIGAFFALGGASAADWHLLKFPKSA
eukprot:COSAG06_NODE_4753_length_3983_cov_8.210681_3_plen_107_part_00